MDLGAGFAKLDTLHKPESAPTGLQPYLETHRSNVRASHDEPDNEELGIVPYRGWRLAVAWATPYLLIALAFGSYVVIAQRMGWWR